MTVWADRLRDDRIVVFLFHGVITHQPPGVRNRTRKHLPQDEFRAILRDLLAAGGRPVSMGDLLSAHEGGPPLPPRAFACTFDDGFWNNAAIAAPILADLDIPATFYVTSDFVVSNRMSWIDRIEWAVDRVSAHRLRMPWGEAAFADEASKIAVLTEIRRRVKSDPSLAPDALASEIQCQLGLPETWSQDGPLDRKMTWDEVRALDGDPLFTVGGHSHTHPILSFLDAEALEREIDTSLDLLWRFAGVGPVHYSYPEGLAHCYSDAVIMALRRHGVRCCPTAEDGDNDARTDPFRLRRVMVT